MGILDSELKSMAHDYPYRDSLKGSVCLITGANGLIGSLMMRFLLYLDADIKIIAQVRNAGKVDAEFSGNASISWIEGDIASIDFYQLASVDYIIHCASPTASKFFVEHPVETIVSIVEGTRNVLDFAKEKEVRSFVYLSSLEVYGEMKGGGLIAEREAGYINTADVRSSYPLAKRVVENLCVAYSKEYNVPVKIARLTQTTGPGISKTDNRVIAQFVRLATEGKDIVLHSEGSSARSYCYTLDAIDAILCILLKGEEGKAYNVANPDTFISARNLAFAVKKIINPEIEVRVELKDDMGYAPPSQMNLSVEAMKSIGWIPKYGLNYMIDALHLYLMEE